MTTTPSAHPTCGAAVGGVRETLRLESLAQLLLLVIAYRTTGASWGLFAALFLVPDLSMLPYLSSKAAGAAAYNAAHNFIAPAALAGLAMFSGSTLSLAIAIIWGAHIAFDRAVGYGLKYSTGFNDTHLGRVGRSEAAV
jgi:hypothetical protein